MGAHSLPGIVGRADTLVPTWAEHIREGDTVAFDTPAGVLEQVVIGFSQRQDMYGHPVVCCPEELEDSNGGEIAQLVLREEDLVGEGDA